MCHIYAAGEQVTVDWKFLRQAVHLRFSGKIDCDQMEPPHEEQYSEYLVESNPRAYMTMRDYRNLA